MNDTSQRGYLPHDLLSQLFCNFFSVKEWTLELTMSFKLFLENCKIKYFS